MSTINPRFPQPPDGPETPAATVTKEGSGQSVRKRLEAVETATTDGAHPTDIPPTAVSASTPATRRKARIQFATLCFTLFLAGWNDGTTGPLLPRIQSVYHVWSSGLNGTLDVRSHIQIG